MRNFERGCDDGCDSAGGLASREAVKIVASFGLVSVDVLGSMVHVTGSTERVGVLCFGCVSLIASLCLEMQYDWIHILGRGTA